MLPEPQAVEYLALGRIGAAYGIKGWVKLISFTDPIGNMLNYRTFMVASSTVNGRYEEIEIDLCRPQGKGLVGHIKGCDDRTKTREFTGKELLIAKSKLPELESDDYYWHQLEGLRVLNRQGDDLGKVHHLIETGANDVLIVRASASSIDDLERLIPYLRASVVDSIDLQQQVIVVNWDTDY